MASERGVSSLSPAGYARTMKGFVDPSAADVPVVPLTPSTLPAWLDSQGERVSNWVRANAYGAQPEKALAVPGEDGSVARVLYGLGEGQGPWRWAALRAQLVREQGKRAAPSIREELLAIGRRCAALPDLDTRSTEEILGYDELGLPR